MSNLNLSLTLEAILYLIGTEIYGFHLSFCPRRPLKDKGNWEGNDVILEGNKFTHSETVEAAEQDLVIIIRGSEA